MTWLHGQTVPKEAQLGLLHEETVMVALCVGQQLMLGFEGWHTQEEVQDVRAELAQHGIGLQQTLLALAAYPKWLHVKLSMCHHDVVLCL